MVIRKDVPPKLLLRLKLFPKTTSSYYPNYHITPTDYVPWKRSYGSIRNIRFVSSTSETPTSASIKKSTITTATTTTTSTDVVLPPFQPPVHYIPRNARGGNKGGIGGGGGGGSSSRSTMMPVDPFYDNRLQRKSRLSPTRDLNFDERAWRNHRSPYRHWKQISQVLDSSPFQRLLYPHLAIVFGIGCTVAITNEIIIPTLLASSSSELLISLPLLELRAPASFASITTAISLLTGFRTNASYGRYNEARQMWGEVTNCCRDLTRETYLCLPNNDAELQERMVRLIKMYPITLHYFLTNSRGGHLGLDKETATKEELLIEFESELIDVAYGGGRDLSFAPRDDKDLRRVLETFYKGGHTPLVVLTCITEILSIAQSQGGTDSVMINRMEQQLNRLTMANCERILRTPLPTGFTRHTARLLGLWSYVLPLVVYPHVVGWTTPFVSVAISYSLAAVEDVGVTIEEPFHVLPLRQYTEGIIDQVNLIVNSYDETENDDTKET